MVDCGASTFFARLCFSDCDLFFHSLVDYSFVDFPYIAGQCDASFVRAFPFLAFPFVESYDFTFFPAWGDVFCYVDIFDHGF